MHNELKKKVGQGEKIIAEPEDEKKTTLLLRKVAQPPTLGVTCRMD